MAGLFDVDKELARLAKQRAKIEKDLAGVVARLSNPKFLEKASQVWGGCLFHKQCAVMMRLYILD